MRRTLLLSTMLIMPAIAVAEPSFPGVWQQAYPQSQSMNNLPAPCQMCHISAQGGNNFNPYGSDLKAQIQAGLSIQQALKAVEGKNSDNDTTGSTNLQEITAGTQPGWTQASASLPAGIKGNLDPVGQPPPPPPPPPAAGPIITAPGSMSVAVNQNAPVAVSVTDTTPGQLVMDITVSSGTVAMSGTGTITGSGTQHINNRATSLAALNADLTSLTYTGVSAGTDTMSLRAADAQNNISNVSSITITVNGPPPPTPPGPPVPVPTGQAPPDVVACGGGWPFMGYDTKNVRYNPQEKAISPATVGQLAQQSVATWDDSVLGGLTVQGGYYYAGDKHGNLKKIDSRTGQPAWSILASSITGNATAIVRTAPALCQGLAVVGIWSLDTTASNQAYIVAVDQRTGRVRWKTLVDPNAGARIFQSPVISNGTIYVGVAGITAEISLFSGAQETFRGSMLALSLNDGSIRWRTYTVPVGYTGGGVWGDTAAIDTKRNQIYIGTGNNFTIPPSSMACIATLGNDPARVCQAHDNYIDSLMALDMHTGAVKWAKPMMPWDSYLCGPGCKAVAGAPDYDFPTGPQLFTVNGTDIVGAGHKSGAYVALRADTDDIAWAMKVGPGSSLGGIERGCATDGTRVICGNTNQITQRVTLADGSTTQAGFWTAYDASSGAVLWQVANPTGARALAPVTLVNGVAFVTSLDPTGMVYALDAGTGKQLWSTPTGASNGGGVSVFNGRIYVGAGYGALGQLVDVGTTGTKSYVFTLPNQPADPLATGGRTGGGNSD